MICSVVVGQPGRPTVLALHGRGADERQLLPLIRAADRSCGVLAPRGPLPCPPGWVWFRRHALGVPVPTDLRHRARCLAGWLERRLERMPDQAPLAVVGYSNGGMLALALGAMRPDLVGSLALLRGVPALPCLRRETGLRNMPILWLQGATDAVLAPGILSAGLRSTHELGPQVEVVVQRGHGHDLGLADARALRSWLSARRAMAAPSPLGRAAQGVR